MDAIEQARHCMLILQCQLGSRPALEELYFRHNRPLGYYLRKMLGRDDVSDVQQEVWLAVIRKISRLRTPEAFVVWFYQIARSKVHNWLDERRLLVPLDDEAAVADPGGDPEPEFSPQDAARIHAALGRLKPAHREVLCCASWRVSRMSRSPQWSVVTREPRAPLPTPLRQARATARTGGTIMTVPNLRDRLLNQNGGFSVQAELSTLNDLLAEDQRRAGSRFGRPLSGRSGSR